MMGVRPIAAAVLVVSATALAADVSPVQLVPAPSEAKFAEAVRLGAQGVIVLAPGAGAPERYAAQTLQRNMKRRWGLNWTISNDPSANAEVRVLLGKAQTFPLLDQSLAGTGLMVPERLDGYGLSVTAKDGRIEAALAGVNGRGVIYGQDTLFQLISGGDGGPVIRCAAIRDWPAIPMRGRPHPHYEYFLKPENWDALLGARLNFIDLRNSIYAFEPGDKFNREEIGKVIAEARSRDLIVFAVVNCGVPAAQHDAVVATFKEFLDLGANAIWLSFDDKGPGENPRQIVGRMLAIGRERGITGDRIAITPPKGSYQEIDTAFNRQIAEIPGMEQALWYWTRVPCAEDVTAARSIGLKTLPSWWHNWPRFRYGSFGTARAYLPVISMAEGWNHPRDDELREAGRHVHAVLPWDGWQMRQHYLLPAIGWWSWRPEQYDFAAIRGRVYEQVFGGRQAAMVFDDTLDALYPRFQVTVSQTNYAPLCPPRLRELEDREQVVAKFEMLKAALANVAAQKSKSLLDEELLREDYLEPMRREIQAGWAAATAAYPEYWWDEHQARVLNAIYDRDLARASELIGPARERVQQDIAAVEGLMNGARDTAEYAAWWRKRASAAPGDWEKLVAARKAELEERVNDYNKTVGRFNVLTENLKDPPIQAGTGAWKRRNRVLATVLPEPREQFWGDWIGGVVERNKTRVACFAVARHVMHNEGSFSELPVNLPLSGQRDRLALVLYLADANKESFGLGYAKWRWSGYRSIKLLWHERELWQADLGIPRMAGEWFIVPLPALPDDLKMLPLRLRVEDYESAKNNFEIVYVGPIRLVEMDRDAEGRMSKPE